MVLAEGTQRPRAHGCSAAVVVPVLTFAVALAWFIRGPLLRVRHEASCCCLARSVGWGPKVAVAPLAVPTARAAQTDRRGKRPCRRRAIPDTAPTAIRRPRMRGSRCHSPMRPACRPTPRPAPPRPQDEAATSAGDQIAQRAEAAARARARRPRRRFSLRTIASAAVARTDRPDLALSPRRSRQRLQGAGPWVRARTVAAVPHQPPRRGCRDASSRLRTGTTPCRRPGSERGPVPQRGRDKDRAPTRQRPRSRRGQAPQ